jgi:hypothetical protein
MPDVFSADEQLIAEALLYARKLQEYLWQELSFSHMRFNREEWRVVFQKRVDKIASLDLSNPSAKVELRKRLVQQAALSIKALAILDAESRE